MEVKDILPGSAPAVLRLIFQNKEKEEVAITEIPETTETTTEISSATNAEDSVIWPEIVRTPETDQEVTIAKTEETDTNEITPELRALDAIIVRSTVTWQETAKLVNIKIQKKKDRNATTVESKVTSLVIASKEAPAEATEREEISNATSAMRPVTSQETVQVSFIRHRQR